MVLKVAVMVLAVVLIGLFLVISPQTLLSSLVYEGY